ncbi:uncharacterized protein [Nicotiana sylvestris]|uniref:uncharacterized protein n=1 Tax=Nicotiana sylvestris TaxID=4096 RepID=UPI00388C8911
MEKSFTVLNSVRVHCSTVDITLGLPLDVRDEEAASSFQGTVFRGSGHGGGKAFLRNASSCYAKIDKKGRIDSSLMAQETRWVGNKAREADGFKLWYSGRVRGKNGVGILVDKDLRELVIKIKRVNDRLMIKIVVGGYTLNVVSAYAPQVDLDEEVKRHFWEDLDGLVRGIPSTEKLIIRGDFKGHIGRSPGGHDDMYGGFDFGDRNGGGISLLEYAKAFELVIANSCYPKKAEHLITFRNAVAKTQIDYLLLRKCDRGLCTDCKVIPSENLTTQHMLLIIDLEIRWTRKKRAMSGIPRVREAAREVIGVSKGFSGGHKGDWWWNEEVKRKVKAKKATYLKLVESIDEGQRSANREGYKKARKEAKLAGTDKEDAQRVKAEYDDHVVQEQGGCPKLQ